MIKVDKILSLVNLTKPSFINFFLSDHPIYFYSSGNRWTVIDIFVFVIFFVTI